jgi:hypothetical protein
LASFSAAGANASPGSDLFSLTISATSFAVWDHTSAPVASGSCETSLRSDGFRTTTLRSDRPTLLRFVDGRLRTVEARGLVGTVELSGPNTLDERCGDSVAETPQPCAKTTRRFGGARTMLFSTRPGSVSVRPVRVTLDRIECPFEPDDVVALPLGPPPAPLHVRLATLTNKRTTRITLTASAKRQKDYASPESGTLRQRASWKLTFVRTGR